MAINLDHVTEQITVTDTATNASLTVQPKGTGAFNIAAGSSGVNLSNGGTVTAITSTDPGSAYTSVPTVNITAPTTAGGVQAVITTNVAINAGTIGSGGTGYTVGNVLTLVGGTTTGGASTWTVAAVSGGVVTSVTSTSPARYTAFPSLPASVTGGSGSGFTFSALSGFVNQFVISNAGSGYVEQPAISFTGGGGSAAAAYATVGGTTTIKGIGYGVNNSTIKFVGPSGVNQLELWDVPASDSWMAIQNTQYARAQIVAQGNANAQLWFSANGSGIHNFSTSGTSLVTQARISHTASAVNYVNVTGAATGSGPTISAQGSDTNIDINYTAKGTGVHKFGNTGGEAFRTLDAGTTSGSAYWTIKGSSGGYPFIGVDGTNPNINPTFFSKGSSGVIQFATNGGNQTQMVVTHTASAVNYVQVTGAATTASPTISAQGSDAVVSLLFRTKGTGSNIVPQFDGGAYFQNLSSQTQFLVSNTASAVNYVQVTGAATGGAPNISWQGSDTNIQATYLSKGTGAHAFFTALGARKVLQVNDATSAVNFSLILPSATGFGVVYSAQGSDTNIPLVLQPKGTGALQAQQTDSTATGGNARGANAVDWSTGRNAATQVASGIASTVSGGRNNTASGIGSVVAGGGTFAGGVDPNTASGAGSVISGGAQNINSGFLAAITGGYSNNVSGVGSSVSGGWVNTVIGQFAAISGGYSNNAAGFYNFIGGGFGNSATTNSVITTQSATMNGTTAVTLSASNASIKVGQYLNGTSIESDTYVAAISGTSLTLSKNATGSSTSTLAFYTPHGVVVGGGRNTATGSYSFIGGGGDAGTAANRNVASGDFSVVVGGRTNTASGIASFVGGGGTDGTFAGGNSAIGIGSSVLGGFGNVANNSWASVTGGLQNLASGFASVVVNGRYGSTRGISGYTVFPASNVPISQVGGAQQAALLLLGRQTTDATATVLTSDTSAAGTINQVILPNNSAYFFTGEVVAGVTGGGNTKGWFIEGVIKRGANAASTALVGTPTVTSTYADAGASTWVIAVTADTTNGGLAVTFTGQASTTIRTVAQIRTTEMTY